MAQKEYIWFIFTQVVMPNMYRSWSIIKLGLFSRSDIGLAYNKLLKYATTIEFEIIYMKAVYL